MAVTAKVLETGEVLIPAEIGAASGWAAGAEIEVETRGAEVVLRRKSGRGEIGGEGEPVVPITLEEFFARVPKVSGAYPSDEEIDEILLKEAARRFDATTRR